MDSLSYKDMIDFQIDDHLIHLSNNLVSYIMEIRQGRLLHVYFGSRIKYWLSLEQSIAYKRNYVTEHDEFPIPFDEIPFEYPQFGQGDYREDALRLECPSSKIDYFDFRFDHLDLYDELKAPDGMPGIQGEGKTLVITLTTPDRNLLLELYYGMNESFAGIFRFQKLINHSFQTLQIKKMASASLDLPPERWKLLSLAGTHLKEGNIQITNLPNGTITFDSKRGSSSSQHPPFLALCQGQASWDKNNVIGLALLYSGNHAEVVERDYYSQIRITAGLHPDTLNWSLGPYNSFCTPQCVLTYSENGLNGMAHQFHELYLHHLFKKETAPLLINSWESFYYNTTSENLLDLAKRASDAGLEMLVIDDGWFRKENNSRSPIGDWKLNAKKIPEGLKKLASKIENFGLETGLWLEPEAISANSELYAKHPEWILHLPNLKTVEGRHEYLLDLSLPEVQEHILNLLETCLSSGKIHYIKWDMNRPLTDIRTSEKSHRYILGLYRILDTVTQKYPEVIIEGCSSGGNRLDPGILAYVHQNWASDNTDPFDRIKIQSGLSLFLPPQKLTAHVSASPNHQTGRLSKMEDRFALTRFFNPGYELNLANLNDQEMDDLKKEIKILKAERDWMKEADFYQEDGYWAKVDKYKNKAELLIFQEHFEPNQAHRPIRLSFMDTEAIYHLSPLGIHMSGEQLARHGFTIPLPDHDFKVFSLVVEKISE